MTRVHPRSIQTLLALAVVVAVAASSSATAAQPASVLDSPRGTVTRSVETPPGASRPTGPTLMDARQRLTLWDIARHRAELDRLWGEMPSMAGPMTLVATGVGFSVIAAFDTLRRSLRSSWRHDELGRPYFESTGARVLGGVGAAMVVAGIVYWVHDLFERRRVTREIRRVQELLDARD